MTCYTGARECHALVLSRWRTLSVLVCKGQDGRDLGTRMGAAPMTDGPDSERGQTQSYLWPFWRINAKQ